MSSAAVVDPFEAQAERRLSSVVDTQESVQSLSLWAIHHKAQHQRIVDVWLRVLLGSAGWNLRLSLFHLCNEILQTCKRRNADSFKDSFRKVLKDAILFVRGSRIQSNVARILQIWSERNVYEVSYVEELLKVLYVQKRTTSNDNAQLLAEFQPKSLIDEVESFSSFCHKLEKTKKFHKPSCYDNEQIESIQLKIREGHNCEDECRESLMEMTKCLTEDILTLESITKKRRKLTELLQLAETYYDDQYSDASVIVQAYKNYGNRINNLREKLSEHRNLIPDPRPRSISESVKSEVDGASTSRLGHVVNDKSFTSSQDNNINKTDLESILKNERGFMTFLPRRIPSLGCQYTTDTLVDPSANTYAPDDGDSTPVQDEPPDDDDDDPYHDPMEFLSQLINRSTSRSSSQFASVGTTDSSIPNIKSSRPGVLIQDSIADHNLRESIDHGNGEAHIRDGISLCSGSSSDQRFHVSASSAMDHCSFNHSDNSSSDNFREEKCYISTFDNNFQSQKSCISKNHPDHNSMSVESTVEFPSQNCRSSNWLSTLVNDTRFK